MRRTLGFTYKLMLLVALILSAVYAAHSVILISSQVSIEKKASMDDAKIMAYLAARPVVDIYRTYYNSGYYKFNEQIHEIMDLDEDLYQIILVNTSGDIMFDTDQLPDSLSLVAQDSQRKINTELDMRSQVAREVEMEGKRIIEVTQPYVEEWGRHDYTLIFRFTMKKIDNQTKLIKSKIVPLALLFLSLSITLIFIISRMYVTGPVNSLTKMVESLDKGNYDSRMMIKSHDEIGVLAERFNKLAEDLRASRETIERQSSDLQKSVAEKTSDLNKKIQELEMTKLAVLNILDDTDQTNKDLLKAREELSRTVKQLKEIDKKKDEFLSVTAHELKTPLTSIKGFTTLLKNEKIIGNKELRDKYFDIIIDDTARLGKLITDILDLSRLDIGTMKFYYEKATATDIMSDVKNLCEMSVKSKNLRLEYIISPSMPAFYTDKARLTQVISNLVNNSIKYTEKGSIRIEAFRKEGFIHFKVTDTGVGIPKEAQPRIFERFYQADSSYTRKVGGSGLGLSICKGIVEALGGRIWFKSSSKGSVFEFNIKFLESNPTS